MWGAAQPVCGSGITASHLFPWESFRSAPALQLETCTSRSSSLTSHATNLDYFEPESSKCPQIRLQSKMWIKKKIRLISIRTSKAPLQKPTPFL